jgi:hypothetical protein
MRCPSIRVVPTSLISSSMEVNGTVRLLTVCFTPFLFQAPAFVDDMALSFTHVVNLGFFFLAYPNVLLLILNVCLERSVSVEFSSNWSQILRTLSPSPLCLNWSWVHSISGLVMSTTATAHACVAPTPAAADPIPRTLPSSREPRTTMPCPCRLPPVQGLSYSSTATQRPATDAADHAHPHGSRSCYHDGPSSVETIWFCPEAKKNHVASVLGRKTSKIMVCYHDGPSSVETIWFCPEAKKNHVASVLGRKTSKIMVETHAYYQIQLGFGKCRS